MSRIFISHIGSDADILQQIVDVLEAAGYSTWYFERDVLPGTSYLIQITEAVAQCASLVLVASPNALDSDQVTKEVVGAFERRKPLFPVLIDITPSELKERQPEWRHALGGTAMITVGPEGLNPVIARIVEGLKAQGIQPEGGKAAPVVHGSVLTTTKTYTPKPIADKIMATRSRVEGERKQVTVLFADVTGFTSMSEKMDPEEVHELIAQCIDFMTEEIHRYEGTIAQFTGEGIMALFGAPIAHEDAPQRAIYAALAIQRNLDRYSEELRAKGIQFKMRIGINTGLVIVGSIGDDFTMEYTAIGDTVNLASRVESSTEPGTILVAENTYKLTEGYFDFEPLGKIGVKGEEEPVKAYRVLRPRPTRSRLTASLVRGLSPFVGRNKELEHLTECFEQVKEGHGQVVGIVGEPGVGKSRVALEFVQTLHTEEVAYLEGSCVHYGDSIAYLPILDVLRVYFDTNEGESESVVKKKIEERLAKFDGQLKDVLPPLHDVLSLEVEDEEYLNLQSLQRRERIFDAIRRLLICECQDKPLVLAIEDLHWIDRTSEEFLSNLIGGLGSMHILLILLYRPEYTPAWVSKTYYSQIRVDQLSQNTSNELIRSILAEGEVAPELNDLILNRAAGNPLFMEEFMRNLIESGCIRKEDHHYVLNIDASDIQVPGTVQGIIAGRMDRLEESLKQTMQVASVIGRDFSFRILQAVTGGREELRSYLFRLQELEFIYEKSLFPELEYTFKHALTQEVAYNSLLRKRRREIHEKIGQAIEELFRDRLEEHYEVLAHHYSKSENREKAYQYMTLSGKKAFSSYSSWEAYRLYREAIDVLGRMPDTEHNKRRGVEVRLSILAPMAILGSPHDSMYILQQGEDLSRELSDESSLARFQGSIGLCHAQTGDGYQAVKYLEQALESAERTQDIELMAPIAAQLCVCNEWLGDYNKTVNIAPRFIRLLESRQMESDSFGIGFNVYVIIVADYGYALAGLGNFEEALAQCKKSVQVASSLNDLAAIAYAEFHYGATLINLGDANSGIPHMENTIKYCEEVEMFSVLGGSWVVLGMAYQYLGEIETAKTYIEKGIRIQIEAGVSGALSVFYAILGMVHLESGELNNARSCAEKALELARERHEKHWEGLSLMLFGAILGMTDVSQYDAARQYILQGMAFLDELKVRVTHTMGYFYLGMLCAVTGRNDEAVTNLQKARDEYQDMGMDYWLRRTQEALQKLENQ